MLIVEEYLLVTARESGVDTVGYRQIAVAGALLAELALRERISLHGDRLSVTDPSPTGDELLDEALSRFAAREGKKPRSVLQSVGSRLPRMVLERMSRQEIMQERPLRALGVRLLSAWAPVGLERQAALREELLLVLTGRQQVDSRTGTLISLLLATHGLDDALPKDARAGLRLGDLKRSAKVIADGRWAPTAVADAVKAAAGAATAAG